MKIFRKIRFEFIKKNSNKKYLKYAIGEIVLVVIGILIALQINLWNEERKNQDILIANLKGVLQELKADFTTVDEVIDVYKKVNQNRIKFINTKNFENLSVGDMEENLENFTKEPKLEYTYFKKIGNSGITNFGLYSNVIEDLIKYYDITIPYLNKTIATYDAQVIREDEFWRYEQNSYEFNLLDGLESYQTEKKAREELIKLLKSPRARTILKIDLRRNLFMIDLLSKLKPDLKKMILDLEKVLEEN
ncbi:DUF6090 family protein [Polaribacter porphyrae]|uniref:Uncharacterized protein n=1 Tax=Polaribacter porphyrae TaxID=1137780 RepID=A0A2S7WLF2_9FLAO|nr:DUF6090 family protein [Polaribacter porphyrae]PQJ78141.1 hypothetical protein BTO18_02565 [Polaribacter porphyrae]